MTHDIRVVVVTGGASGIGKAIAEEFAAKGWRVVAADRDLAALGTASPEIDRVRLDVTDPDSVNAMYEHIARVYGRLDACVTCAGIITKSKLLEMTVEEWNRNQQVNLLGTFLCVQGAYRAMIPAGQGSIVAIASDTAKRGGGRIGTSAYAASKAGVLALVKSAAREMVDTGIRINAVCPGPVDSPMHQDVSPELRAQAESGVPLGRFAAPSEIATSVYFIASPEASFVYGTSFDVDGGVLMS
jgi:3-oxoacyl-[acyl-carrier protein] reductase